MAPAQPVTPAVIGKHGGGGDGTRGRPSRPGSHILRSPANEAAGAGAGAATVATATAATTTTAATATAILHTAALGQPRR